MSVRFKICGVTDPADAAAAILAGASYLGFVIYPPSPRHLSIEAAQVLAGTVPEAVERVALTVDADDAALDAIVSAVPLTLLQLHGREPPERVAAVRARFGLPVMKALGVGSEADVGRIADYEAVADRILVDARPAEGGLPGGNGIAFDWRLIAGRRWRRPWMLAGGLTPDTVAEAVRLTGAAEVDVSSGVEASPGIKDPGKLAAFGAALRGQHPGD